jgi:sugar lactone lactonase YvrE
VLPGGFNAPFGLALAKDGDLYIADGPFMYRLTPGGEPRGIGMLFTPGYPGYVRGLTNAADGNGFVVTTSGGAVALYRPADRYSEVLADGFDQLYGVVAASGGVVIAADLGAGRVVAIRAGETEELAGGLLRPIDVAVTADGDVLVAESGAGRVVKIVRGKAETLVDGLQRPHGILIRGDHLYIVDVGAKTVIEYALASGTQRVIAADLAVGAPPGVVPKPLRGIPPLSGPMGPFAGIADGPDGTLYVSADGEGSIIALRRPRG